MKKLFIPALLLALTAIMLTACGAKGPGPEVVVEEYLTALVNLDNAQAVNLSCAAWEENANAEGASFEGVEVALEEMECSVISEDGTTATVGCEGNIVFSYAGGEDEFIPLSRRNFSLTYEAGEWRMCGYE
jgi:hypothetical protein